MCARLSVCLSACLSVCLSVRLPACLSVCLSVSLPACLPACLPSFLPACLSVCLSVCLISLSVYLSVYLRIGTCEFIRPMVVLRVFCLAVLLCLLLFSCSLQSQPQKSMRKTQRLHHEMCPKEPCRGDMWSNGSRTCVGCLQIV